MGTVLANMAWSRASDGAELSSSPWRELVLWAGRDANGVPVMLVRLGMAVAMDLPRSMQARMGDILVAQVRAADPRSTTRPSTLASFRCLVCAPEWRACALLCLEPYLDSLVLVTSLAFQKRSATHFLTARLFLGAWCLRPARCVVCCYRPLEGCAHIATSSNGHSQPATKMDADKRLVMTKSKILFGERYPLSLIAKAYLCVDAPLWT